MPALYTGQYDMLCTLRRNCHLVGSDRFFLSFFFFNKPVHVEDGVLRRGRMPERRVVRELSIKSQVVLLAHPLDVQQPPRVVRLGLDLR